MFERIKAYQKTYLKHLREVVTERVAASEKSAAELWLELPSAKGIFKNYYRVDVLTNDGSVKTFEANIDLPKEEIEFFEYRGVQIKLEPILWNGVQIECEGIIIEPAIIELWFNKWFDEDEKHQADKFGLSEVIHSISIARDTISADFGSAPVEALIELLNLLIELEPQSITIHSQHKETN